MKYMIHQLHSREVKKHIMRGRDSEAGRRRERELKQETLN